MNTVKKRAELIRQADDAYRLYLAAYKIGDAKTKEAAKWFAEWRRLSRLALWSNDGTPECGE